jgi:ABC-type sugar transport system ATPase subunit
MNPDDRPTDRRLLLSMQGIDKRFPGVHALRDVDLTLFEGEVLALVGENGAGKSTLIKVLGGAHLPDAGTIHVAGRLAGIRNPIDARRAGVGIIYQEFNLVPHLSARENIFLGQERTRGSSSPGATNTAAPRNCSRGLAWPSIPKPSL